MTDPGAIPLPDFITLIILAGLGLLGFLLLTRYDDNIRLLIKIIWQGTSSFAAHHSFCHPCHRDHLRLRVAEYLHGQGRKFDPFLNLLTPIPVKVPNTLAIVGSTLVILSVIGVSAENIFLSKFHNTSIYPTNL